MPELARSMLGRTGLEVTRLGYGSMELRFTETAGRPDLSRAAAGALLHAVLDLGINYIDTSPTYGMAEELIGDFLGSRRDEFVLATKTGFVVGELPARRHVFTREVVRTGLEWSLRRLKTDHVDIVQLPGSPTPKELIELGTLEELEALKAEGKCRYLGISGWLPSLGEHLGWDRLDVYQIPYSALELDNGALIDSASDAGVGTVIRGGIAQGGVSEDRRAPTADDGQAGLRQAERRARFAAAGLDALIGEMRRDEFMIRYLLSNPSIDTAIIGTSSTAHLESNIAVAARGPLAPEHYSRARALLDAGGGAG